MIKPRVKICCIKSTLEAKTAIEYGASALGLVSDMPSGPGIIHTELIREIASIIPPGVASFLLTSKQHIDEIIEQQHFTRTNTIQLCDRLITGSIAQLKRALPGISIVQVVHVVDELSVKEALTAAEEADAILLDSGNQNLPVKELGGTGRTHDWNLSKTIREKTNKPIFIAGGLKPENIHEAVEKIKPYGVDICSGVRTDGNLDVKKLHNFFKNLNSL